MGSRSQPWDQSLGSQGPHDACEMPVGTSLLVHNISQIFTVLHSTSQYFRSFQWGQHGRRLANGAIHNLHNDESWCNTTHNIRLFAFPNSRQIHAYCMATCSSTFSPHDVLQVYHRDFDLICKEFGYCDPTENVCLTRVPGMCPPQLFEWNEDKKIYETKI